MKTSKKNKQEKHGERVHGYSKLEVILTANIKVVILTYVKVSVVKSMFCSRYVKMQKRNTSKFHRIIGKLHLITLLFRFRTTLRLRILITDMWW